jgi:hypothetical protein
LCRNPNFPVVTEENRGRYSGLVDWSPYDPTYKKYLQIGKLVRSVAQEEVL